MCLINIHVKWLYKHLQYILWKINLNNEVYKIFLQTFKVCNIVFFLIDLTVICIKVVNVLKTILHLLSFKSLLSVPQLRRGAKQCKGNTVIEVLVFLTLQIVNNIRVKALRGRFLSSKQWDRKG